MFWDSNDLYGLIIVHHDTFHKNNNNIILLNVANRLRSCNDAGYNLITDSTETKNRNHATSRRDVRVVKNPTKNDLIQTPG